jgi:hypothetical protein
MKKILKYTAFAAMVGLFSSCSDSFFEAESGDRSAFCHYWHVLLLYHIFIINNHLKNI